MQLAIVIPAYKATYLAETLHSLVTQQLKNFHVYIGDDASPEPISNIVASFEGSLQITYRRFDDNLGSKDLTGHWKRCIDITKNEPWIWLLPDDDVALPECVFAFLNACAADIGQKKLYRFQTSHINSKGELLFDTETCEPLESNTAFLLNKLRFQRSSSVAEYIFSKKKYNEVGGFTTLPLAWGSDDWLWIQLSQEADIVTLPAGRVLLRQSKLNISANTQDYTVQKFEAKYRFWELVLKDHLLMHQLEKIILVNEFKRLLSDHLFFEYSSYDLRFLNANLLLYAQRNNRLLGGGLFKNIYRLLRYEITKRKWK
jgi:glycosyltransferase involved in cell wall biosynthesis